MAIVEQRLHDQKELQVLNIDVNNHLSKLVNDAGSIY